MIEIPPTLEFCLEAVHLSWSDVLWAVEKGIFGWRDVQKFAVANLDKIESSSFDLDTQIAALGKNDASEIMDLARSASSSEGGGIDTAARWRFLLLKWVYENRPLFANSLGVVEDLYAEFGFPQDMEAFVPFLPPSDGWEPTKHSQAENEMRLFDNWRRYLEAPNLSNLAPR